MQVQTRGEFGGLGIEVTQEEGFVKVVSPIDGTPAAAAGIKPGDYITKVDGEPLLGLTLDKAVDLMRGPVGSEITITVVRKGEKDPFDVTMTRDTIKLTAAKARLEGHTAVLRLTTFNDQTYHDMATGLDKVVKEAGGLDKINGVVIDLRNNPGGPADTRRSRSPTPSSRRARSSRPAAATRRTASASTPPRAT